MTIPEETSDSDGRKLPSAVCPACGYRVDAATCLSENHRPSPGDLSLCARCAELFVFESDMTLKRADLNDLLGLNAEEKQLIDRAQAVIRRHKAQWRSTHET